MSQSSDVETSVATKNSHVGPLTSQFSLPHPLPGKLSYNKMVLFDGKKTDALSIWENSSFVLK